MVSYGFPMVFLWFSACPQHVFTKAQVGKTPEGSPRNDQRPETAPRPAENSSQGPPVTKRPFRHRELLGEHSYGPKYQL